MSAIPEAYRESEWHHDLLGAVLAGLCVGFLLAWTRLSGDELNVSEFTRIVVLAVCSYSVVALLIPRWKNRPLRKVPNWVLIAFAGSLVYFLSVNLIPDVRYIWKFRNSGVIGSASEQLQEEVVRLIVSTAVDSLIALLAIGVTRYIGRRVTTIRRTGPAATDRLI